ncbi:MAG: hypothetical protein A2Z49_09730 [Chloroflexi bacterium RBG_19FT_COMBO_56_12]|nr:MAG: hypothetical protein A2Z49_09730 [Chloroflexi bacterium RBG_19FT_COMBO_56_12]
MSKIHIRSWRVINLILIVSGLLLPWIRIYFDNVNVGLEPAPPAGWIFFLSMWQDTINDLSGHGFELFLLPFWLTSLSGFLIVLYLVFNLIAAIKGGDHKGNKVISIILIGTIVAFLFLVFESAEPALGYWLTNLGVFSSAVLEWQS